MTVSQSEHDRIVQECLGQVNHRANNLLAVIHGIIRMTTSADVESFKKTVEGRIGALAQAHSLLTAGNWSDVPLKDIINGELINFIDPRSSRLSIEGTDVILPPARAQNAAMIMHELAVNAVQHGALRVPVGRIIVRWVPADNGVFYYWHEDGLSDCKEPAELGTGLHLVERISRSTRATVTFSWPASGIHVDFFQPYDSIQPRESVPAE